MPRLRRSHAGWLVPDLGMGGTGLMRRGSKRIDWTTAELDYLIENAGKISHREICRHLKRSSKSVERKAALLRANGFNINMRTAKRRTRICPSCGQARSEFSRKGFCRVCDARNCYVAAKSRQAEAYVHLPQELKDRYDETEAQLESSLPPRPQRGRRPSSEEAARRWDERCDIEVETWELECLKKLTDAAKKRTQRMREHMGTNPRKNKK